MQYTLKHADLGNDSDPKPKPKPKYNCLSYTWGYPQWDKFGEKIDLAAAAARTQSMTCDSQTLLITPNLESALARLENDMSSIDAKTGEPVPMWIDSICIHQENKSERSSQVAKMDKIYRDAQKVVVWLGPENELYTSTAVAVLKRLSLVQKEKRNADIPAGLKHAAIYSRLGIDPIKRDDWVALGELLMRTWFSRMWVIQETFEASTIVVYCGKHELSWSTIIEVSETLEVTGLGSELMALLDNFTKSLNEEDGEEVVFVGNKVTNQWLFQALRKQKEELKLETLLSYARYFGATGHHDYVYAVRGMWKPKEKENQRLRDTITPNYDLAVEDVFTAATYASIVEMGDLNILCFVEDDSLRSARKKKEEAELDPKKEKENVPKKLPSWVPDWSITPIAETLCMNPRPEKGEERWRASDGLEYSAPPESTNKQLHVKGVHVTTIAQQAAKQASFEVDPDQGEIFALLEFLLQLLEKYPSKTVELVDAFWKTIIKDTYREEQANDEARKAFTSFVAVRVSEIDDWIERKQAAAEAEISEEYDEEEEDQDANTRNTEGEKESTIEIQIEKVPPAAPNSTTLQDIEKLLNTISSKEPSKTIPTYDIIRAIVEEGENDVEFSGVNEDNRFFDKSFQWAQVGRRLFSTFEYKEKILLGVGPESLKEGDQVWVIAGMYVPVVLRRAEEERWRLVGECFVEGIMNGEAVKDIDEKELKEVVLV